MSEHPERRETDWLFNRINSLEDKQDAQHARLRDAIKAEGVSMRELLAPMAQRLDDHSGRLIVIETERKTEKQLAVKRGAWAGILAGIGFQSALQAAKMWWK